MVDSLDARILLPPAELVSNRIDEKRLFEARFLFNKFSRTIDAPLQEQLQQQLKKQIDLAEEALARGELLEQACKIVKAAEAYEEVAKIAIDHPSLARAQQRVELAIKLEPLQSVEPSESEVPLKKPSSPVISPVATRLPAATLSFFRQHKKYLLLGSSLPAALGFIAVFFFFRPENEFAMLREVVPAKTAVEKDVSAGGHFVISSVPDVVFPFQETNTPSPETVSVSAPVDPVQVLAVSQDDRKDSSEREQVSSVDDDVLLPPLMQPQATVAEQSLSIEEPVKTSSEPIAGLHVLVREEGTVVLSTGRKVHVRPLELLESRETTLLNDDGTYTVQPADSLGSISRKLYGNSWRWNELYKLNSKQLPSPGALEVGQVLQVNKEGIVTDDNRQPKE